MKILAENETVSIRSDDEDANVAHAKMLLDLFGKYQLDEAEQGQTTEVILNTPIGEISYFVFTKVIQ